MEKNKEIIYAIKTIDLVFGGLKIFDVKIGKTNNIKSTLSQYKRSSRDAKILDLWTVNPQKTQIECEKGAHKIAEKYAYKREGEKFIFLQENYKEFSESINLVLKNIPKEEVFKRKNRRKRQKINDYTGNKPKTIKFQTKEYEVNTWREVLHIVAKQIYKDKKDFSPVLKIRGKKRNYFSRNDKDLRGPVKIKGTPYFFEGNSSANQIKKITKKLLNTFGYKDTDLEISLTKK